MYRQARRTKKDYRARGIGLVTKDGGSSVMTRGKHDAGGANMACRQIQYVSQGSKYNRPWMIHTALRAGSRIPESRKGLRLASSEIIHY